jgi:thiamine biosynthesis lipoprotein
MLFGHKVMRARPLLGTRVDIRVTGLAQTPANAAIDAAFAAIADIHRLMSFHEPGSDVSRLNRDAAAGPVAVDPRTFAVIRRAQEIAAASAGVFDICAARALVTWGFLPAPDSRRAPDPSATWRDIVLEAGTCIRFAKPLWIDLGGIAKGFAVDAGLAAMKLAPEVGCLINAGGDLRVAGPEAERVLLRLPPGLNRGGLEPGLAPRLDLALIPAIEIADGSLASSSGPENRRAYREGTVGAHVDGVSGESIGANRFVTVTAAECVTADALTKVVMAAGVDSEPVLRRFQATAYLYESEWITLGEGNEQR